MAKDLKGSDLIPGKMYVFGGSSNYDTWPAYRRRPQIHLNPISTTPSLKELVIPLSPLEPFVFLERLPSEFRWDDNDRMYDYKVLTGEGVIGWLSLHDDDLHALGISFREFHPKDFEEIL